VAVVDQPVDEGPGHDVIPKNLTPHSSKLLLLVSTVDAV
jgi:hypothetical protein